jgi:predicted nucleotidyltransferase component of viral defense system
MKKFDFKNTGIEKELLYMLILESLSRTNLFKDIVFQGGNTLRLCYMGKRYSEDLDFVMGRKNFLTKEEVEQVRKYLEKDLKRKIENQIEVVAKEGRIIRKIVVKVLPDSDNLKKLEVHVKIANVPARSREFKMAQSKSDPNLQVFVLSEKLEEILADKIVAFGGRAIRDNSPFKAKDIWDINWLIEQGIQPDKNLVLEKLKDYSMDFDKYLSTFKKRLDTLNTKKGVDSFNSEMRRYAEEEVLHLLDNKLFTESILNRVSNSLNEFLYKILRRELDRNL